MRGRTGEFPHWSACGCCCALPNSQISLVVFNKKEVEQVFQVEADSRFFGYPASARSIVTFV
jgi:hypothetical protein